jgi:hypothetical protein
MAHQWPEAFITAVDLSADQLANARRYCDGSDRIDFQSYDFYSDFPLPGGPADLVLAVEVFLHHPPGLIRKLLRRIRQTAAALVHVDWFEPWSGPFPPHVWIHDFPAYYREIGWECAPIPLPEKTEGKQQVLFVAADHLPASLRDPHRAPKSAALPSIAPRTDPVPVSWEHRLARAMEELSSIIPVGATFILADGDEWGVRDFGGGRRRLPFMEKDGAFWGAPPDDNTALTESLRLRDSGAGWFVVGWNQFWMFAQYPTWQEHLQRNCPCVLNNERLVIYQFPG